MATERDPLLVLAGAIPVSGGRRASARDLWIAGDRFVAAGGATRDTAALRTPAERIDLTGHLVFPGLVNAHDHLHLNVFPRTRRRDRYDHSADWAGDMAQVIETPAFRALRSIPVEARVWHGALKNVLAGATTVVHHDPWLPVFDDPDFPVTVVPDVGWCHSLDLGGRYGPPWADSLAAAPRSRPWFIHLAEGTDARASGELDRLARGGGLGPGTRLIHAVGIPAPDVRRAIAAGAGMVWCPASNAFLLGGVADPRPWAAANRAALGTDARLTGARDLLDEIGYAVSTGLLPAGTLLRMATRDGARLCGRPSVARLSPGAPADAVILRDDGRPPAEQLAGARRADLRAVLGGGRAAVADPDLGALFAAGREPAWPAELDGRPKHVAARVLRPCLAAGIDEPGLAVEALDA